MHRQCESFSRIFSSATGLDKSFIFIRNTWTSLSINENSEIFLNFLRLVKFQKFQKNSKLSQDFKISKKFQKFQFS